MEELFRLIPDKYAAALAGLNADKLCELRIRNGLPVGVCYDGVYYYLAPNGITRDAGGAFSASPNEAEQVVMRACGRSIYTVTETLKRGYVAVSGGIRIGVCGSAVMSGGSITALKDFSSVNIRIPHEVIGCGATLFGKIAAGGRIESTLIVSPPGAGKTTVLRDLCRIVSEHGHNVMLCDEKYEIAASVKGVPTLNVGPRTDVISGADKHAVLRSGIAHMRPDVIMTDELFKEDTESVVRAAYSGVSVIATAHASSVAELLQKPDLAEIAARRVFARYAVIGDAPVRGVSVYPADGAEHAA